MEKRYYQFSQYLRDRFGCKTWKLPIDAGFTCPNRDGTLGSKGCIFCDNAAFSPRDERPPLVQLYAHMKRIRNARKVDAFIIYFQTFSNTYAPIAKLKKMWDEAIAQPGVVGLSIGTRPDCLSDEILELLSGYLPTVEVWLELGVQTIHDSTLEFIERKHNFAQSRKAIIDAANRGLKVSVHLIIGLPGETTQMIRETIDTIATLPIHGIKIHPLQIIRNTRLADLYNAGEFSLMSREVYLEHVCDLIERLPPHIVIQRLTAEAQLDYLIAPKWGLEKMAALNRIDIILKKRGTRQGSLFQGKL
ncbi:TIGR01212 family radical SAM protein [bacterium]|nr:TIGR01212 family radical SAM protein [bacterium]